MFCALPAQTAPAAESAAIKQGDDFLNSDQLSEATAAFRAAVKENPKSSDARQRLGRTYALAHKLKDAADELTKALQLNPRNVNAHVDLGWVYGMQGAFNSSISEERAAVQLDPRNVDAYMNLGVALAHEGSFDAASEAFRSALSLDPENYSAIVNLASVQARNGKFAESIPLYRKAIAMDGRNVNAHIGLAGALGKVGDTDGEVKELQIAAALSPQNPSVRSKLGWALYHKHDWRGALLEGIVANSLQVKQGTSKFFGTLATLFAALFLIFGVIFTALFFGAKFIPLSGETVIKSFFLVFYKDKPGRFVVTDRRLLFLPETLSQWFGATRLSFEHVDIETFRGSSDLRGARLSLLCNNGMVYHFAMPALVLDPVLTELRKVRFGGEEFIEEMVVETEKASQLRLGIIKREKPKPAPEPVDRKEPEEEGTIITVVELPDEFKKPKR